MLRVLTMTLRLEGSAVACERTYHRRPLREQLIIHSFFCRHVLFFFLLLQGDALPLIFPPSFVSARILNYPDNWLQSRNSSANQRSERRPWTIICVGMRWYILSPRTIHL